MGYIPLKSALYSVYPPKKYSKYGLIPPEIHFLSAYTPKKYTDFLYIPLKSAFLFVNPPEKSSNSALIFLNSINFSASWAYFLRIIYNTLHFIGVDEIIFNHIFGCK